MEFSEKLEQLRKQNDLTQEQLAKALYVSRTAISKWESGRGYPNIDSLMAIADYFCVTVDELLTGGEVLSIAQQDQIQKRGRMLDFVFGLLDVCIIMLMFLPVFGQKTDEAVLAVSLLSIQGIAPYVKFAFITMTVVTAVFGIMILTLQNCSHSAWTRCKYIISVALNMLLVLLFVVSPQPNCAVLCFAFLTVKALLLYKKR